jgi:MFS superfamily sulfate permease-like transporter
MKGFLNRVLVTGKVKKKIIETVEDKKTGQRKYVLVEEKDADLPDCRGDETKWPEYWKKACEEEGKKNEVTGTEQTTGT